MNQKLIALWWVATHWIALWSVVTRTLNAEGLGFLYINLLVSIKKISLIKTVDSINTTIASTLRSLSRYVLFHLDGGILGLQILYSWCILPRGEIKNKLYFALVLSFSFTTLDDVMILQTNQWLDWIVTRKTLLWQFGRKMKIKKSHDVNKPLSGMRERRRHGKVGRAISTYLLHNNT